MSQADDKPLHDWVRQSLADYRPDYDPADWTRMQRKLRYRSVWRRRLWISLALLGLISLGWLGLQPSTERTSQKSIRTRPAVANPVTRQPPIESRADNSASRLIKDQRVIQQKAIGTHASPVAKVPPVLAPVTLLPDHSITEKIPARLSAQLNPQRVRRLSSEEAAIVRQVQTGEFGPDSTTYRAIDRNLAKWPDAVLVCDLTTSMYPYTTQLLNWFNKHARHPSVQGMVFFTDCDSLGRQTRPGGLAGRMYVSPAGNSATILPILLEAARNTVRNEDDAENDVEALLFAQRHFPQAKHLILIADNLSRVKDMNRLKQLNKPVHVILCGTTGGDTTKAFQPEFYGIARHSGGSMHTLEDDLNPSLLSPVTTLRVGPRYYRYMIRQGRFKLTPFHRRPKRYLGFVWL